MLLINTVTIMKQIKKELTPLTTTYESFFGLHPLSQVLDQTNPLTQIVHGKKLSYESAFLSILTC